MNEKRNILNNKLNSIDHKLDVDALWDQLEPMIPVQEPIKKRPIFWFWSGVLLSVVLIGGLSVAYLYFDVSTSDKSSTSLTTSIIEHEPTKALRVNTQLENLTDERAMQKDGTNEIAPQSEESKDFIPKIKQEQAGKVIGNESIVRIEGDIQKSRKENNISKPQSQDIAASINQSTSGNTTSDHSSRVRAEKQTKSKNTAPQAINMIDGILKQSTTIDKKIDSTLMAATTKKTPNQKVNLDIVIARLAADITPIGYQTVLPPTPSLIDAPTSLLTLVPYPSRWGAEVLYTYGRSLSEASYSDSRVPLVTANAEQHIRQAEHVDAMGVDFNLTYDLTAKWSMAAGLSYFSITDKVSKSEGLGPMISEFADGGYQILNQSYLATAYDRAQALDLNLGVGYNLRLGRLTLQPGVGLSMGLQHTRERKIVDVSAVSQTQGNQSAANFRSISSTQRIASTPYLRLAANYPVTERIDLVAGIKYIPSRKLVGSAERNSELHSMAVGQVGLRYRF